MYPATTEQNQTFFVPQPQIVYFKNVGEAGNQQEQSVTFSQALPQRSYQMERPVKIFKRNLLRLLGWIEIFLAIVFCTLVVVKSLIERLHFHFAPRIPYFEIFSAWDVVPMFACGIIALKAYHGCSRNIYLANFALSIMTANTMLIRAVLTFMNITGYNGSFPTYSWIYVLLALTALGCATALVLHFIYFSMALSFCSRTNEPASRPPRSVQAL